MIQDGRGFALPVALFALVVVGILVTGGFFMANQETRISASGERATLAFYHAERGIARVTGESWDQSYRNMEPWEVREFAPQDPETDGYWRATLTALGEDLFLVSSQGRAAEDPGVSGTSRLSRVIRTRDLDIDVPGAVKTSGSLRMRGSARVDGRDRTPEGWEDKCGPEGPDHPGVIIDEDAEVDVGGDADIYGDGESVEGCEAGEEVCYDEDMSEEDFTQFGDLSWDDLTGEATHRLSGGTYSNIAPVFDNGACDTSVPTNWGDPGGEFGEDPCADFFPLIHVDGDLSLQSDDQGQGILMVDGDISLQGDFHFHGFILVQGSFETRGGGEPRVWGGVMASDSASVEEESEMAGSSVVQYSSCAQQRARTMSTASRPVALPGRSWSDVSSIAY